MRSVVFFISILITLNACVAQKKQQAALNFYAADNPNIQYTGRVDFTNPKLPRFWQPGVYIETKFLGSDCEVILNDEIFWGNKHNYLEIIVDGKAKRIQTKSARDTIIVAKGLSNTVHTLTIAKNTEANIGYLELVGINCKTLVKPLEKPIRKIEFIGNSITCGTGSDMAEIPCGKGVWEDQHNAWMSYGAVTARTLHAQYFLSAVSGVGLMHSCCNMDIIMPQVFDKVSMRDNKIEWDFKKYQPAVVTICLGQNDGIQDAALFCKAYINFIKQLREHYKQAKIILLTSPMADAALTEALKKNIIAVKKSLAATDKNVEVYFFSRRYSSGCDTHPSLEEHQLIAAELTTFIKQQMNW